MRCVLVVLCLCLLVVAGLPLPDVSCACEYRFINTSNGEERDPDPEYCTGPPAMYASRLCGTYNVSVTGIEPCYHMTTPVLCDGQWTQGAVLKQPADESNLWLVGARYLAAAGIYRQQTGIFSGAQTGYIAWLWDDLHALLEGRCNMSQLPPQNATNATNATTPTPLPLSPAPVPYVTTDEETPWSRQVFFVARALRVLGGLGPQCRSIGVLNAWSARVVDVHWSTLMVPPLTSLPPTPSPPTESNTTQSPMSLPPSCVEPKNWPTLAIFFAVFSAISLLPWMLMGVSIARRCARNKACCQHHADYASV